MSLGYELVVFTSSFKFIKFILVSHPYKRSLDKRSLDCARDFASRLGRLLDGSSSSSSFRGHFIQQVVASGVRDKIKNTRCNVHDVQQGNNILDTQPPREYPASRYVGGI